MSTLAGDDSWHDASESGQSSLKALRTCLVKLSKKGTIFTYTEDYLSGAAVEDFVGIPVIDLDGGGRLRTLMTECEAGQLHIDMPVELVLRKMHEGGGYNNYFWKARPLR